MKSCFELLRKSIPVLIFCIVLWLSVSSMALAQSSADKAVPVLEGLDPVMLVQGKEVQGNLKIAVTRGQYQYLFANEENKAAFEKDPARYEIQLDGACARMGPPVYGNTDLYSVYQGRIYIFGSGGCKKAFDAAPEKYFALEAKSKAAAPEALKKGRALIEQAVAALGGAARLDGLTSYQEKSAVLQNRRQTEVEIKRNLTVLFPDRIRLEQSAPDFNNPAVIRQMALVIAPSESFMIAPNGVHPIHAVARAEQEREFKRRPLSILRARKGANFNPAATGSGKVGETAIEQVAVEVDGTSYTLGIDPTTGRTLSLSYLRRGPDGTFGKFVQLFSDFRMADGLTLPFKVTTTFNDQPWGEQSPTIESIGINGKIDPALFEKPKSGKTQ
jgi:YHS domain-containing protein